MNPLRLAILAAMALLAGCAREPAGEETSQGQLIANRPDGLVLNQQHTKLVTRWRGPMDHGAAVRADWVEFRVWEAKFGSGEGTLRSHPVEFVWERAWSGSEDHGNLQNPSFFELNGKFVPNGCFGATLAAVKPVGTTCLPPNQAPQAVQIGGRSENVAIDGTRIVFGAGLDGRNGPCALDLLQIADDVARPLTANSRSANAMYFADGSGGNAGDPAYRFAVSYFPPREAFLIDYGQPDQPIFRATCAGFSQVSKVAPLLEGLVRPGAEKNFHPAGVLDMVADPGQTQPALFVSVPDGESGLRMLVLRAGKPPQAVPYFCHDCLPDIGGFFLRDPNRLVFGARLEQVGTTMRLRIDMFDLRKKREESLIIEGPKGSPWPSK